MRKFSLLLLIFFILNCSTHKLIDRVHASKLSYEDFINTYAKPPGKPVIIEGAIENWPALKKWNFDYFKQNFGDTIVRVQKRTKRGLDPDEKWIKIKHYIDYAKPNNNSDLYFSNWVFSTTHWELLKDFEIPIYFKDDWLQLIPSNVPIPEFRWLFIGTKGSGTPLHQDTLQSSAWFATVTGEKHWIYYPPNHSKYFKDKPEPENLDDKKYERYDGYSKRGDIVFTPSLWWHKVNNLSPTIGLTINYMDASNQHLKMKMMMMNFGENMF
eukprot:gene5820-9643_t